MPEKPLLSERALELIANRFKLLAEPMRLRILQLLMTGEKSVSELVESLQATQANVSKHLGLLVDGGLIARRKSGAFTLYRVADPSIITMCDLVCNSLQVRGEEVLLLFKAPEEDAVADT
jgi:DNA-binding transcriptional ArsR family regulator